MAEKRTIREHTDQLKLSWDRGTAYDFFLSISILQDPGLVGLPAAWAAGMRSRLPGRERATLEAIHNAMGLFVPSSWLVSLTGPKNGKDVLHALGALPPAQRIPALWCPCDKIPELEEFIHNIAERGSWTADELTIFRSLMSKHHEKVRDHEAYLDWFSHPAESGEKMLEAYQAYQDVFFAEEEMRIKPALDRALDQAQAMAQSHSIFELLEELDTGVRFNEMPDADELILAPSFWVAPLIAYDRIDAQRSILLFGAREKNEAIVPGEVVPEAMVRVLKALSNPTRLRIMQYLAEKPFTPTQLAGRLRLRSSTVVHHIRDLRLAALVELHLTSGKEVLYSVNQSTVLHTCQQLKTFLKCDPEECD